MRFSKVSILALPLLAAATQQQNPLDQAKAQAQYWFDRISSFIPNPNRVHSVDAAAAKAGGKTLKILTLDDWEHTIRSSVKPASVKPEEWWVFVTGGNKTCFGACGDVETAFNETAALWAVNPSAPHLAYLNCDDQPVLCNSWGAGPPNLWIFSVAAPPALVDVRVLPLNASATTVKTFVDLRSTWKEIEVYDGFFHPFDGPIAKFGLAKPVGYFFWVFTILPSWLFMIIISFVSRNIMSRRMAPPMPRPGAAPAGAPGAARTR